MLFLENKRKIGNSLEIIRARLYSNTLFMREFLAIFLFHYTVIISSYFLTLYVDNIETTKNKRKNVYYLSTDFYYQNINPLRLILQFPITILPISLFWIRLDQILTIFHELCNISNRKQKEFLQILFHRFSPLFQFALLPSFHFLPLQNWTRLEERTPHEWLACNKSVSACQI